jgi:hypothetical protein
VSLDALIMFVLDSPQGLLHFPNISLKGYKDARTPRDHAVLQVNAGNACKEVMRLRNLCIQAGVDDDSTVVGSM